MKIEVLRTWLENSDELDSLIETEGVLYSSFEIIQRKGFRKWMMEKTLDGANPIDLYIKTEQYVEAFIPIKTQNDIRDIFWETLTKYLNEQPNNQETSDTGTVS